ncbi:MAG: serpin family protein [Planctomycetota bacterium]
MGRVTSVLVLAAVVVLASVAGAAEAEEAPMAQMVQANSEFAIDLYRQIEKENAGKNLFFSPYSISSALAMAAEGARGETALEMGQVLCFPKAARRGGGAQGRPWETTLIHQGIAAINRRINQPDKDPQEAAAIRARIAELREQLDVVKQRIAQLREQGKWRETRPLQRQERDLAAQLNRLAAQVDQYEIHVANALWGEQTYPFDQDYIDTIARHYGTGGVFPVDFRAKFPEARERINAWAARQTHDRITNIIPRLPPEQARLLRLILTNAIYFKGQWSVPFEAELTKDRDFTLASGEPVKTPIMSARGLEVARYAAFNADGSLFDTPRRIRAGQREGLYPGADGFAVLELPYKGDELAMVVIAPNSPDGLPALENKLTREALVAWIAKAQKRKTHVLLPRFKLETDYKLGGTLQEMGMVRAFIDPGRNPAEGADFSGMTTSTKPEDRLFISKVLHKAFVEVNEKGTEAAAVTAVMMAGATAMPTTVPFIPTFKADRPFLFLIRDRVTGSILFLGRVTNPKR